MVHFKEQLNEFEEKWRREQMELFYEAPRLRGMKDSGLQIENRRVAFLNGSFHLLRHPRIYLKQSTQVQMGLSAGLI
jgi:hypothetical protein